MTRARGRTTGPHRPPARGWTRLGPPTASRSHWRHEAFGEVWRPDPSRKRWYFAPTRGERGHARTMRAAMVFCEAEATRGA